MSDNEENQKQTIDSDAQNTTCPHIKDAIRLENIEGPIEKLSSNLQCETCSGGSTKETDNLSMKTSNSSGSEHTLVDDSSPNTEPDPISARDLFLCLSCGQLNCGREDSRHALAHYNESKEHCIVINIKTLDTWCYTCDDNLKNLTEDQSQTIDKVQSLIREASESKDIEIEETPNELIKKSIKNKYRITAPGLQNLGNTCFFNSLMQVVAATSVLHDILDTSNPYYNPPLVSYKKCPAATSEDVGPLTDNFKSFLDMMWKQHDGTVNPKNLFQEISRKWQQFRGWRQQDSQEVMRYLFDGIKSEEFELIKKLSAHKKDDIVMEDGEVGEEDNDDDDDDDNDNDDDNDDDDVEVDEISSQGSINQKEKDKSSVQKYESFIDACFGGKLVSVIVCDTCDNCSYSYEEFLDVSLPIKSPNQTESQKYTNESATYYSTYDNRYGSRDDNSSPHSSGGDADDGDAIVESDDNDGQQKKFDDETKSSAKSIKRKKRNKLLLRESHSNNNNNNKNIYSDNNNGNSFSYGSYSYNHYFSSSSIKENDISLIDCLNSFMRVETLEGDNAFACGNCWQIKEKREKKLKQQKLQEQQKQQQEIIRKVEDADVIDNGEEHREMIEEQVNKNSNDDGDDDKNDDFNNDDDVVVNDNNDNNYNKVEETDNMIISRTTPDHNTHEPNDAEDSLNRGGNNDYNGDGTVNGDDEAEESDDKMIISQTAPNDVENPLNNDDNDSNNNSCNVVNSRSADNNNGYSALNSNGDNNNDNSSSGGDNNSNYGYNVNDCSMFGASSNNNNNSSSTYNTHLPHTSSDTSNHNEMTISTESSSSSLMERERERERTTAREKSRSKSPPKREKFKLQKAYKRYLFASLPPVLVFHLKRFQQVGSRWSMHMKKIDDFVSFEEEIDVGEFVVPPEIEEDEEEESDGTDADDDSNNNYKRYKADEISNDDQVEDDDAKDLKKQQQQNKLIEQPSQSTKYRLYGVVVHLGSLFNGHYIAFVLSRNIVGEGEQAGLPNLSYDDRRTVNEIHKQAVKTGDGHRQWIYCSDSSVRSATVEEALSSGAYLLFYERVNE